MFVFMNYSGHGISHDHQIVALLDSSDPKTAYFEIEKELRSMAKERKNLRIVSLLNCCSQSVTWFKGGIYDVLNEGRGLKEQENPTG